MPIASVCNKFNGLETEAPTGVARDTAQEFGRLVTEVDASRQPATG